MTQNQNFPHSNFKTRSDADFFADEAALRQLGVDQFAYIRPVDSEKLANDFPQIRKQVHDGLLDVEHTLWTMFSAEGLPIAVANSEEQLFEMARQTDLEFAALH